MLLMIRMLRAMAVTAAALLLGALALPPSPASAQAEGNGYAEWTLAGSGDAFTGTMSLPASFPTATYTSDSRAPAAGLGFRAAFNYCDATPGRRRCAVVDRPRATPASTSPPRPPTTAETSS